MFRHLFGRLYLFLTRWKWEGSLDDTPRCVVVAAPHTTNWDMPKMQCIGWAMKARFRWLGKKSLFRPPGGWFLKALGGVPVDRSSRMNMVEQAVERFGQEERFALVIPPEGTRSKREFWKSGFYHIACGAQVPIALSFLDYSRKVGGIGLIFQPTGEVAADMERIRGFYRAEMARFPELFTAPRLEEEGREG